MIEYKIKEVIYQDKSSKFKAMYKKHWFWHYIQDSDEDGYYAAERDSITEIINIIRQHFFNYRRSHKTGCIYHDVDISVDNENNIIVKTY